MSDNIYMQRALELAKKGVNCSPNPLVGAVIVKDRKIIGEGYHHTYGEKHAEVEAIDNAIELGNTLKDATLYCTLEPCSFENKTKKQPPCTQSILKHNFKRVVIANQDPNPLVAGEGIRKLRGAGLSVSVGIEEKKAAEMNQGFFTRVFKNRPFYHLKMAQSLDGRVATFIGDSKWITDQEARGHAQANIRRYSDAIMIGKNTALNDNPQLTIRLNNYKGKQPYRIVLDSHFTLPPHLQLFNDEFKQRTILVVSEEERERAQKWGDINNIKIIVLPLKEEKLDIAKLHAPLIELGINSVMIEGGSTLHTAMIKEGLWDKISCYIAPLIIGKGIDTIGNLDHNKITECINLSDINYTQIGKQILIEGYKEGLFIPLCSQV